MRIDTYLMGLLLIGSLAGAPGPVASMGSSPPREASFPRGPYLLRQIFGDDAQSGPTLWGITPGVERGQLPNGADLGKKMPNGGGPTTFLRKVGGRANVAFVFDGSTNDSRLDHVTVTIFQSPGMSWKAVFTHLSKIYGPADPSPEGEETVGRWQKGAVVLNHFPSARFFEVTLSQSGP